MRLNGIRIDVRYVALALGLVALVGCTIPTAPPTTVVISNSQTQLNGGLPGGPSPSPSPTDGTIGRVGIGAFGEGCGNTGKSIAGSERDFDIRLGCDAAITCTPYLSDGKTEAPEVVHGPTPTSFGVVENSMLVETRQDRFNITVHTLNTPGKFRLQCCVKGVCSPTDAGLFSIVP